MDRTSLLLVLMLINAMSAHAFECPSVHVEPPAECDCFIFLGKKTLLCNLLTEAPVIPNIVEWVKFSVCRLTTIQSYIFENATDLQAIEMYNCRIQSIDGNAFQNIPNLNSIDISYSEFGSDHILNTILQSAPQLQSLVARHSFSVINLIDTRNLTKHNKLVYLDLSGNAFLSLDFRHFHQLEQLLLDSMHLPIYPTVQIYLSGMQHLKYFSLVDNADFFNARDIHMIFKDLPSLEHLTLDNNRLDDEAVDLFKGLHKLKELSLINNKLYNLPVDTFNDLAKLQKLDLQANIIAIMPKYLFQPMKEIELINLKSNKLTILYPEHFQNLNKLHTLNLMGNNLVCACGIRPFVSWIQDNGNRVSGFDNLICTNSDSSSKTLLVNYAPSWLSCDNHGWLLAGLCGTLLLIILLSSLTVYYFRWDIRFCLAVRRTRKRLRREATNHNEADEGARRIQDDHEADERTCLIQDQEDYHAFASYCSKDSEWVRRELVVNLEEADDIKFRLCIDERDFMPGLTILRNISLKMSQSKKIIFVVSRSFIESRWCTFEVDLAQTKILDENTGMIIIIFLEKIPKRDMPRSLCRLCKHVTHITWDDSPRKQAIFWKRLKLAMNA